MIGSNEGSGLLAVIIVIMSVTGKHDYSHARRTPKTLLPPRDEKGSMYVKETNSTTICLVPLSQVRESIHASDLSTTNYRLNIVTETFL